MQTCTFSVSSALFACLPHRSVHLHHHPCHASWHNILLVVPSTPSCSAFAIIHVYPIFPTYVFLPSHSLLTPPSNHASADQTVPDPPPVLSLSLLTVLPLLLPVSYQNETWLLRCPRTPPTFKNPSTTYPCAFNRHLTYGATSRRRSIPR